MTGCPVCYPFYHSFSYLDRIRVVPHFPSGIIERAKRQRAWKSPHTRKGDTRRGERKMRDYGQRPSFWPFIFLSSRRVSPFLALGDFHARSRFARSTIPEEKWGKKSSLLPWQLVCFLRCQLRIIGDRTWKNLTLSAILTEILCELLFICCPLSLYESL